MSCRKDDNLVRAYSFFLYAFSVSRLSFLLKINKNTLLLSPSSSTYTYIIPQVVQDLKEEVLAYERLMLHVLGFNLNIDTPGAKFWDLMTKVKGVYGYEAKEVPSCM